MYLTADVLTVGMLAQGLYEEVQYPAGHQDGNTVTGKIKDQREPHLC